MRILIVDDDMASRCLLSEILTPYGDCCTASDGVEAVLAVRASVEGKEPFDLICLDIRMPNLDGLDALGEIRRIEESHGMLIGDGAKTLMITALSDTRSILDSFFQSQCDGYLTKPITREGVIDALGEQLGLLGYTEPECDEHNRQN